MIGLMQDTKHLSIHPWFTNLMKHSRPPLTKMAMTSETLTFLVSMVKIKNVLHQYFQTVYTVPPKMLLLGADKSY